jgi:hypothetical protein
MLMILNDSKDGALVFRWSFGLPRSSNLASEIIASLSLLVSNNNAREYYENQERRDRYRR